MKIYFKIILALFIVCICISCDSESNELVEAYKNSNHSEELKGWWKEVSISGPESEYPLYFKFNSYTVNIINYIDINNKYEEQTNSRYWYNTDSHIYFLTPGSIKAGYDEEKMRFKLNVTKDTLYMNIDYNIESYYVKSEPVTF